MNLLMYNAVFAVRYFEYELDFFMLCILVYKLLIITIL